MHIQQYAPVFENSFLSFSWALPDAISDGDKSGFFHKVVKETYTFHFNGFPRVRTVSFTFKQ